MKHVVVTRDGRIAGVLRVNTELRRGLEAAYAGVTLGRIADRKFTVARVDDIVFDIIARMTRHGASMAVVTKAGKRPRPGDVVGIISKEHISDCVAESIRPYSA